MMKMMMQTTMLMEAMDDDGVHDKGNISTNESLSIFFFKFKN